MRGININNSGKVEKNQKVKEGDCIFPFKHQWKEYNECADSEKGKICATSVTERGTLKTYGYCTEQKEPVINTSKTNSKNNTLKKSKIIPSSNHKSRSKSPDGLNKGTKTKALTKTRKMKIVTKFPSNSKSKSPKEISVTDRPATNRIKPKIVRWGVNTLNSTNAINKLRVVRKLNPASLHKFFEVANHLLFVLIVKCQSFYFVIAC